MPSRILRACLPACLSTSEIKATEHSQMPTGGGASELNSAALKQSARELQLQAKVCFSLKPRARNVPSDDDCRSNQQSSDRNQTRAEARRSGNEIQSPCRALWQAPRGSEASTVLKGSPPHPEGLHPPPHTHTHTLYLTLGFHSYAPESA